MTAVAVLALLASVLPPAAAMPPAEPAAGPLAADGPVEQVVVLWRADASADARDAALARVAHHLEVADLAVLAEAGGRNDLGSDAEVVRVRRGSADAAAAALAGDPAVRAVERDRHIATPSATTASAVPPPDDPLFGRQWGLHNTGQDLSELGDEGSTVPVATPGVDVRALAAWATTLGSADVRVAIIDTIIDVDHPDLDGAIVEQRIAPSLTQAPSVPDPGAHGTAVASVLAARADDGVGIAGVAPEVSVLDLATFAAEDGVEPGGALLSEIVAAVNLAVELDADVINASWETPSLSPVLREAIADSGIAVVAAAGNGGQTLTAERAVYPAGYDLPNVLGVTAIAADGSVPPFANVGADVIDLGAPGDAILVAYPDGEYRVVAGTSFAAPYVAGGMALALTVAPYLDVADLVDAARWTSRAEPALDGVTRAGGMLDAAALLHGVQQPVCRPDQVDPAPFTDVDPTSVHAVGIACLAQEEVALGRTDGTYGPGEQVTRAQLASLLGRILVAAGVAPVAAPPAFDDVEPTDVHAPSIALLSDLGIIEGRADGTFGPDDPVTRGQMASLLVRTYAELVALAGEETDGSTVEPSRRWFDDTAGSVHADNIDLGRDVGVVRGTQARHYAPATFSRRDQIATFVARLMDAIARDGQDADGGEGDA